MSLQHTVKEVRLKNGALGLLIDVPNASVMCYEFSFRAGNDYAARPAIQQTAHILEHMAFTACKAYPSGEAFSQEFTKHGAYNNATTWDTDLSYYGDCADMEWDRILDLQRQAITEALFTENDLVAEKRNVKEELTGQLSNYGRILWQRLGAATGSESFLDKDKLATIPEVQIADIKEHYKRTHTLENMRFVVAGNLKGRHQKLTNMLELWELPKGSGRLAPKAGTAKKGGLVHVKRTEMDSMRFGLVMLLNRRLDRTEHNAVEALNHILTGTFHSRIFGKARSQGLCYSMGSDVCVNHDGTSEWRFGGQVTKENAKALYALIVSQLQAIAAGQLTESELADTKLFALGSFQKSNQTVGAVASSYSGDYFFDGSIHPIELVPKLIQSVTKRQIEALAKEFLDANIWSFGAIGNVEKAELSEHYKVFAALFED